MICVTAGIDTESFQLFTNPPESGEVVFVGSFDWQPNVDGAVWLIEKVWPSVRERFPSAHLTLVGRKPPPYMEKAECESISLTGWVDSVEEYIKKASICVVPLWIGSGMRLKILEAFAFGRPVVSTSLGAEGIEITDGRDIIIRDEPEAFADAMVELLSNPDSAGELARNARNLVEKKYSWENVAKGFREAITGL